VFWTQKSLERQLPTTPKPSQHNQPSNYPPKIRSIGLGEKIVAETLPQAGTPNVEAVAVMANTTHSSKKQHAKNRPKQTQRSSHGSMAKLEKIGLTQHYYPAKATAKTHHPNRQTTNPKHPPRTLQKDGAIRKR